MSSTATSVHFGEAHFMTTTLRALLYFFQQTFIRGYCMPGTVLGSGDKLDGQNLTWCLPSWSF